MTDLTDRMRTCAAWIIEHDSRAGGPSKVLANVTLDAADLLIEASNALESATETLERGAYDLRDGGYLRSATILEEEAGKMKGEPMEIIPPVATKSTEKYSENYSAGTWITAGDTLPVARPRSPHACPKCDSRANKTVRRMANTLVLVCPVCAHTWPYTKKPPADPSAGGQE